MNLRWLNDLKRLCVCLVLVLITNNSRAGDKKETPRLDVALKLSVDTCRPNNLTGTLTCVVHNRSKEEVRLPAQYDGREVILYGQGKTHRGQSNLWKPNLKTQEKNQFVTISPGQKKILFELSLKDILATDTAKGSKREWAWDWRYRMEPPQTPIHGWRRVGYEERASFLAQIKIGAEKFKSNSVILTIKSE